MQVPSIFFLSPMKHDDVTNMKDINQVGLSKTEILLKDKKCVFFCNVW